MLSRLESAAPSEPRPVHFCSPAEDKPYRSVAAATERFFYPVTDRGNLRPMAACGMDRSRKQMPMCGARQKCVAQNRIYFTNGVGRATLALINCSLVAWKLRMMASIVGSNT